MVNSLYRGYFVVYLTMKNNAVKQQKTAKVLEAIIFWIICFILLLLFLSVINEYMDEVIEGLVAGYRK